MADPVVPNKEEGTPPAGGQNLPKADPKNLYQDPPADDKGGGSKVWADNWREELAKGDDGNPVEARANILKRFQNPTDLFKAYEAANNKIRSGEYKKAAMPKADDAEAMSAWRKENGIPEDVAAYGVLPTGDELAKLPEMQRGSLTKIQEAMHKNHITLEQGKGMKAALEEVAAWEQEQVAAADAEMYDNCEDTLRADWGADYRNNLAANTATMQKHLGDDWQSIISARTQDGRIIAHIPAVSKMLNTLARLEGADLQIDGDSGGSSLESRKAEIEGIMASDMSKYTSKMADEYSAILAKLEARGKL